MTLNSIVAIATGGGVGAVLRIISAQQLARLFPAFPQAGTLGVNVLGCFLMGVVWGLTEKMELSMAMRLFIISGGLGAFTTFSTFALDAISISKGKGLGVAMVYILLSNLAGIIMLLLGERLTRYF